MKKILILCFCLISLNAGILKEKELDQLKDTKQKNALEADLLKDSLINPLSATIELSKDKNNDLTSTNKKASINFNQDIFRSGGIYYTIKKSKQSKKLSFETYENSLDNKMFELAKSILNLRKIDLKIKRLKYLIKNKKLEISKKQEEYLNGTIDIENLDTVIIENNDLSNQVEDLRISKFSFLKDLKKYSLKNYERIELKELKLIKLEEFLQNNKTLLINKLKTSISKYDQKILTSGYFPKVAVFSELGYQKNTQKDTQKDFYNYGLKITVPLDFNMNKNKEIAKLNYKLLKREESLKKDEELNTYETILKSLLHLDKKILNYKSTIKRYEEIYELTNDLYEGFIKTKEDLITIENRLNASKLDINILKLDKQLLLYELNKNTKK